MDESSFRKGPAAMESKGVGGEWKDHAVEFGKAVGELAVECGKGVRDIVKQSLVTEDSFLVRILSPHLENFGRRLRFLNEFLPEDKDPRQAWSVILLVSFFALAGTFQTVASLGLALLVAYCFYALKHFYRLEISSFYGYDERSLLRAKCAGYRFCHEELMLMIIVLSATYRSDSYAELGKQVYIHPPTASLVLLPDGRHLAYQEQGVPAGRARFTLFCQHTFLSSRLAGIPGIKSSTLMEFGIRLISYDLPGFGESDPHFSRNLQSSALDLALLANALNVYEKFWVIGVSEGSMHTWAALRHLPDRVAGAAMFASFVNPYESGMSKKERHATWSKWTSKRKLLYFLAQRFPRSLRYFYRHSFLSGSHGQIDKWLSFSAGKKDKSVIESSWFKEFWKRDVEESIRQSRVEPFIQEAALQVSSWNFNIADIKMMKNHRWKGFLHWLKSSYSHEEDELPGFLGPIHIWQGMEDRIVPPSMTDFIARIMPEAIIHKLPYDGHFTYFYFCDECHRQIFVALFGIPKGPLEISTIPEIITASEKAEEDHEGTTGLGKEVL